MFSHTDILGWVGTALSLAFYLLLGLKRVQMAYIFLAASAVVWGILGYLTGLSSLVAKEVVVGFFVIWGWHNWHKGGRNRENRPFSH